VILYMEFEKSFQDFVGSSVFTVLMLVFVNRERSAIFMVFYIL